MQLFRFGQGDGCTAAAVVAYLDEILLYCVGQVSIA